MASISLTSRRVPHIIGGDGPHPRLMARCDGPEGDKDADLILRSLNSFDALLAVCKAARQLLWAEGVRVFCEEELDPVIAQAEKGKS